MDGDDGRGGWWKGLLLVVGLVALAAVLVALIGSGDDGGTSAGVTVTPTALLTPSATTPAPTAAAAGGPGGAGSAADGTLVAGGERLLGSTPATLTAAVGEQATGTALGVVSVTASGFWVGTTADDRTFIGYAAEAGEDEDEDKAYEAKVGDTVDLAGPVRPAPADPAATLELDAADAAKLEAQGAYVAATAVTPR